MKQGITIISQPLIERIRQIMKEFNLNQSELANKINILQPNLSAILNGKRPCDDAVINKFVISLDINKNWLKYGEGKMLKSSSPESNIKAIEPFIPDNLVKVRLLEISPTASFTDFAEMPVEEYDYTYVYPIEGEEIGDDDVVFSVNGESMEPTIKNKSRILGKLIKKAQWHWAKGIVIIAYNNSFVVKRIFENKLDTDNYLIIGSDNPEYTEKVKISLDSINIMYQADRIVYAPIR